MRRLIRILARRFRHRSARVSRPRRNPRPKVYAPGIAYPGEPEWHTDDFTGFTIPRIYEDLDFRCHFPDIFVSGYNYNSGQQPYRLEVWIEKTDGTVTTPGLGRVEVPRRG